MDSPEVKEADLLIFNMRIANIINVGIVKPPLTGHLHRGTGTYFQNLVKYLSQDSRINIKEIENTYISPEFDLIHFPYFDPFFITMPGGGKLGHTPHLVTVHDLIPLKYPDKFPKGILGLLKWNIQKNSLLRANHIITDSQSSKKEIIKILDIRENKVSVIYLGVEPEFKKITNHKLLVETCAKLNLPDKFILHVGDVNYNKNIPGLISAFSKIEAEFPALNLVLVGRGFVDKTAQLAQIQVMIKNLRLDQKIYRLAGVSKEDLINLYNLAQIYIQPSFAEGFGLPVIEAFACGVPVIAAESGSLPEIADGAAYLVDPENTDDIANGIKVFINDANLSRELTGRGFDRVKKFNWSNTATETFRLYQKVLGIKDYQL